MTLPELNLDIDKIDIDMEQVQFLVKSYLKIYERATREIEKND